MYYDYETRNKSFIEVHTILKDLGVKNNNFMLQLHNKDLLNINPFDSDLTEEQKTIIRDECNSNFWYFIREILRWEVENNSFPMKLDRGNAAIYWNTLNGVSTWRTDIRQSRSDLSVRSILFWIMLTKSLHESSIISNKSSNSGQEIYDFANFKIPEYIHESKNISLRKTIKKIYSKNTASVISTILSPRSDNNARMLARGNRSNIVFFHQAEFIKHLEVFLKSNNIVLEYMRKKYPDKINVQIFNSNYGQKDEETTIFSIEKIERMIKWKDSFYDKNIDEYKSIISEYGNNIVYIKHSYQDLGYSDDWANNMKNYMNIDDYNREILLRR